jgi:polysaccharide biosynthesis transport protein
VIFDNAARDGEQRWYRPASRNGHGKSTQLARLMEREVGHGPGTPGSSSRFLVAHARWILGVTLVVVAAAALFAFTQTRLYASTADVVVEPSAAAGGGAAQQPELATEESVVASGAVLSKASQAIGVPVATLSQGLSVTAKGASFVLHITYANPDPHVAQRRAQAIAQAYTSFRSATPASNGAPNTAPVATLITPASLHTSPYSPKYALDLGAALLIGLALAIVTAWGRDYLDDRLRGPLDLERQADADVLGMIPAFHPTEPGPRGHLVMTVNPGSIVAEAYRSLRTRVLLTMAGRNSGTILVTSPTWEGRGTVAANLAAALAQSGRSTILVCADLHWGRAQLLFGVSKDAPGLAELLEQRTDLSGALHATSVSGLRLLPPGAPTPDPAALLQLPALRAALSEIRAQADAVVIEAPPLLVTPDVRPLADCAEIVLLIADAQTSTRAQVRAAVRELEPERARLAGCVLVNVGRRRRVKSGHLPSAHPVDDRPRSASTSKKVDDRPRSAPTSKKNVTRRQPASRPRSPGEEHRSHQRDREAASADGEPMAGESARQGDWAAAPADGEPMAGESADSRGQQPDG